MRERKETNNLKIKGNQKRHEVTHTKQDKKIKKNRKERENKIKTSK